MGRYRNVSILAAAIFLQIVGLAVQVKRRAENRSTRLIRVWTVAAVTPLEKNIVRVQSGASDLWHNYIYLRGVRQENRDLEQQIQQLQLEQVRLRQDAEQAHRLQALLGFKEQFIDRTTAAQVIGSSGSEQSKIVYLDKGSADGIATDMAVISSQGVVGKVIQVFRHTSQVLLINDQTSGVGTILEHSRLQGVLKGKASGELVLDNIMAEEDVKPGERVLTSGGDQIFPKGLPVGTVASVHRGAEFLQATVQPSASLNHLEEVLVITKKQEREPVLSPAAPLRAADILAERLPSVPDKPAQPASGVPSPGSKTATAAQNGGAKPQSNPASGANAAHTAVSASGREPSAGLVTTQTAVPRTEPVGLVRNDPGDRSASSATGAAPKTKTPATANPLAPTGQHAGTPSAGANAGDLTIKKPQTAPAGATVAPGSLPKKVPASSAPQPTKPVKPAQPAAPKTVPGMAQRPAPQQSNSGDAPQ